MARREVGKKERSEKEGEEIEQEGTNEGRKGGRGIEEGMGVEGRRICNRNGLSYLSTEG